MRPATGLPILDIQMPDGDGVAVLGAAKRLAPGPAVMVLTNCADGYHRLRCEAAGADFFLDKSEQFEEIPRRLRSLIEQGGRTMADTQAAAPTRGHRVPTDG